LNYFNFLFLYEDAPENATWAKFEKNSFRNFSQIRRYRIRIPIALSKAIVDAGYDWGDIRTFLTSKEGYDRIFRRQTTIPAFFRWGGSGTCPEDLRIELEIPDDQRSKVREEILLILKECVASKKAPNMVQLECSTFQLYKRDEAEILAPFYVRRVIDAVRCLETFKTICAIPNGSTALHMSLDNVTNQVNTGQGLLSFGDGTYMVKEDILKILLVSRRALYYHLVSSR
jgi:hypothetical protein